jgi:hypothetical protein
MTTAGQRVGKHVPAATEKHRIIELLEVISRQFALSYKREFLHELIESFVREINDSVVRQS